MSLLSEEMPVEWFTLADYILAVMRRWKLIVVITGLFLVLGFAKIYWDSRPQVPFPYTTVVEIGRLAGGSLLEDISTVKSRLETAYIPRVLIEHALKGNYDQEQYIVEVVIPDGPTFGNIPAKAMDSKDTEKDHGINSNALLLLQSKGSKENKTEILSIHQDIITLLLQDHEKKAEFVKKAMETDKFRSEIKLDELASKAGIFSRQYKLIDDTATLLRAQISTTIALVNSMEKDRSSALASAVSKDIVDQSLTTTLLLIDTDISRNQEKIRALEERLRVTLENDRNILEQEELENKRQQKEQAQILSEIEFKINNIQKTVALLPPSQLLQEAKHVPWINTGIYGIVGLVLAFAVVGLSALGASARKYAINR